MYLLLRLGKKEKLILTNSITFKDYIIKSCHHTKILKLIKFAVDNDSKLCQQESVSSLVDIVVKRILSLTSFLQNKLKLLTKVGLWIHLLIDCGMLKLVKMETEKIIENKASINVIVYLKIMHLQINALTCRVYLVQLSELQ